MKPPVTYTNWEADALQGCVCDPGYEGYDCSFRSCPWGPDPSDSPSSTTYSTYTLECQADAGYFTMIIFGQRTSPIPYDADVELLERILLNLNHVNDVLVTVPIVSGVAQVCNSAAVQTISIQVKDLVGPRPPMMVSLKTAANRQFADADTQLTLSSSTPVLRMKSVYTLTCPACASCAGSIIFTYGDDATNALSVTATG